MQHIHTHTHTYIYKNNMENIFQKMLQIILSNIFKNPGKVENKT